MKKLFSIFFIFALFFLSICTSHAQDNSDQIAKKYNISFPIASLGNCTNITSCKTYCEDATHQTECIAFAKEKGFYKEPINTLNAALIQAAETELGCTSQTSCKSFCEQQENKEKCSTFAKTHNITSSQITPQSKEVLQKAETELGCTSQTSCKSFCEQQENKEKCSTFAKQTGLSGGLKKIGPGGCDSQDTCKIYCQSHSDVCKQFSNERANRSASSEANLSVPITNTPPSSPQTSTNQKQNTEIFCKQNPEKCIKEETVHRDITREQLCKQNPRQCIQIEEKLSSIAAMKYREQFQNQSNTNNSPSTQSQFFLPTSSPQQQQTPHEQPLQPQSFQQQKENIQSQHSLENEDVEGASTHVTMLEKIISFFHF